MTATVYDARSNPIRTTDPLGAVTTYTWNARGELLSEVDVPGVLLEWARGARGGAVVRQLLEDGKSVVQRPEHPSATLGGLSLTAAEQWALEQANGVSSAGEIAARSPMGEHEALRSLCGLLLAGLLVARSPKASYSRVVMLLLGPRPVVTRFGRSNIVYWMFCAPSGMLGPIRSVMRPRASVMNSVDPASSRTVGRAGS